MGYKYIQIFGPIKVRVQIYSNIHEFLANIFEFHTLKKVDLIVINIFDHTSVEIKLAIDVNDILNISLADKGLVFVIDKLNTNSDD